ncbi:uncharacterized protein LOC110157753 isoform X2 [Boleophthalmus pectinirostris]|uniref:uncharacterized protein LOC110157753 isoform X2 n=1 Tax=Boleophthalmus pectinirostris TaxID=150288 RepID=UPI000A1C40DF|nr:uncharacterized protein LOC110157753 isoform X2 [Boleophthalmus pectinirostris]
MMAPGRLLLLLCLSLSDVAPVWPQCEPLSIHNLSCYYNYNRRINCEWTSDTLHRCIIQGSKTNVHKLSNCTLEPPDQSGMRRCSLLFNNQMKNFDVLSLKLSCDHLSQSLVTSFLVKCHVKLEAPDKPAVNGSSLSWASPKVVQDTLEYELQLMSQEHPWGSWPENFKCKEQCRAELDSGSLVLGGRYSARVRVRMPKQYSRVSEWSDWGPTLSWESTVGEEQKGSGTAGSGTALLGTFAVVVTVILVLTLMFWTSKTNWVYVMKFIKGDPLPSPTPSVLKMGWKTSPFSSDSFLTFFRPVEIYSSVELLPTPRPPLSPLPDDKLLAPPIPSLPGQSSFSNPIYSHLCPTAPLLPCSADSPYGPHPDPNPDPNPDSNPEPEPNPDLPSHMGELPCPELELLLLLMSQQCQEVPVSDYERVEAVGTLEERVRLPSVDSGMGSGEEVSHDSLHLMEDQACGSSLVQEDQTGPHPPGSLTPVIGTA